MKKKCKYRNCSEDAKPIKENISTGHWLSKFFGKKKEIKVIGYKDYCDKHEDWISGGLE